MDDEILHDRSDYEGSRYSSNSDEFDVELLHHNAAAVISDDPHQLFPLNVDPDKTPRWFDRSYAMPLWPFIKVGRVAGLIDPFIKESQLTPVEEKPVELESLLSPLPNEPEENPLTYRRISRLLAENRSSTKLFSNEENFLEYINDHLRFGRYEENVINNLNDILNFSIGGTGGKPSLKVKIRNKIILGISLLSFASMLPTIVYVNDFLKQFGVPNIVGLSIGVATTAAGSLFVIFGNKAFLEGRFAKKVVIKDAKVKCKVVGLEGVLTTLPAGFFSSLGLFSFFYEGFGSGEHLSWPKYVWMPLSLMAIIFPTMGNAALVGNYIKERRINSLHWMGDVMTNLGISRYNSEVAIKKSLIAACQDRFDYFVNRLRSSEFTKGQVKELVQLLRSSSVPLAQLSSLPGALEQQYPTPIRNFFVGAGHLGISSAAIAGMWYYLDVVMEMSRQLLGIRGVPPAIVGVATWVLNGFVQDYLMYKLWGVVFHEVRLNLNTFSSIVVGLIPTILFGGSTLMQNLDSAGSEDLSIANVKWYQWISVAFTSAAVLYSYNRLFSGIKYINTGRQNAKNELKGMLENMREVIARLDFDHALAMYNILYAMSPEGDLTHRVAEPSYEKPILESFKKLHR